MRLYIIVTLLIFRINSFAQSFTELVKQCEKSVFTVITYDTNQQPLASGTGFFINKKGYGVSNVHVFKNSSSAFIQTIDKKNYEIDSIVSIDEAADILVFSVKDISNVTSYLEISNPEIEKGEEVFVIGTPKGLEYTVSKGILSSIRNVEGFGKTIQFTAPISPGSSGSPLLNLKGQIIGIVTFQLTEGQNLNFATDINRVKNKPLKKLFLFRNYFTYSTYEDFFNKGLVELERDSIEKAIFYFTKEIVRNPKSSEAYFQRAFCKQKLDDFNDAIADYNSGLKITPKDTKAISLRGYTKYRKGDYKGCIEDQTKSLLIKPNDDWALWLKGECYYHLNDYTNALLYYNSAIKLAPDETFSYFSRGQIKRTIKKDFIGAMADFNKVITLDPNFTEAYLERGECKLALGDLRGAIDDYSINIEQEPNNVEGYFSRGNTYFKLSNFEKALLDLNIAAELDKESSIIYYLRAFCKLNLEDKEGACKDLSKAGELGETAAYNEIQKYCK